MKFVAAVVLFLFLQGCDVTTPDKKGVVPEQAKPIAQTKPPRPGLHRFVRTRSGTGIDIAFDTQTGQICRTWEWVPIEARKPGHIGERIPGELSPTCLSLYRDFPSGSESGPSREVTPKGNEIIK
jgi:hypothetical protein